MAYPPSLLLFSLLSVCLLVVPTLTSSQSIPSYPPPGPLTPNELYNSIVTVIQSRTTNTFTVPPGTYNFSSSTLFLFTNLHYNGPPSSSSSSFSSSGDDTKFLIQGNQQVVFLFAPGYGITLINCSNLHFSGITTDISPLPFTQGQVLAVPPKKESNYSFTYTLLIDDTYPLLDEYVYFQPPTLSKTIFWNRTTREMLHWQVATTSVMNRYVKLGSALFNVTTTVGPPLEDYLPSSTDTLCTISPVLVPTYSAINCSNLEFTNITIWGSSSMGYVEGGGYGNTTVTQWRAVRAPGTTRLLATNLDGIHSTSMEHGLYLRNSEVSYAADDLFAVHCELGIVFGSGTSAASSAGNAGATNAVYIIDTGGNAKTIALAQPGALFQFFAFNSTMDPLYTGTVKSVTIVQNTTLQNEANNATADIRAKKHLVVRPLAGQTLLVLVEFMDNTLPSSILTQYSAMVQTNDRCGYNTRIENTYFHDTTGGVRLKGVNVTYTNNVLERGYGINMLPEYFWTQSISSNISITNNLFVTTGGTPVANTTIEYNSDTCPGLYLYNNTIV